MKCRNVSLCVACITFWIASCVQPKNPSNIFRTGFDEMRPWLAASDALIDTEARSGRTAIHVGPGREYSMTWEQRLDDLQEKGYSSLHASIWIKCPQQRTQIQWVASISSPTGVNYAWVTRFYTDCTTEDSKGWRKAEVELPFPSNAPDAKLKIYGWSPLNEAALLDDFELEFH